MAFNNRVSLIRISNGKSIKNFLNAFSGIQNVGLGFVNAEFVIRGRFGISVQKFQAIIPGDLQCQQSLADNSAQEAVGGRLADSEKNSAFR